MKQQKPLKERGSITPGSDIAEKAKELSEEADRSFSRYISIVLKKYLRKLEEK